MFTFNLNGLKYQRVSIEEMHKIFAEEEAKRNADSVIKADKTA